MKVNGSAMGVAETEHTLFSALGLVWCLDPKYYRTWSLDPKFYILWSLDPNFDRTHLRYGNGGALIQDL